MYENTYGLSGFSLTRALTPPSSVRNLVSGIFGAVVKGTTVTIPTPLGPQVFNLGNPADVEALKRLASGARFNVATPRPGGGGIDQTVRENVPGGWATIGILGLVGLAFLVLKGGKARMRSR